MTPRGGFHARTMKRLPREKQSDCEFVASCRGIPWELRPKHTSEIDRLIAAPRKATTSIEPVVAVGAPVPSAPELTEIDEPEAMPVEVTQGGADAIFARSSFFGNCPRARSRSCGRGRNLSS